MPHEIHITQRKGRWYGTVNALDGTHLADVDAADEAALLKLVDELPPVVAAVQADRDRADRAAEAQAEQAAYAAERLKRLREGHAAALENTRAQARLADAQAAELEASTG